MVGKHDRLSHVHDVLEQEYELPSLHGDAHLQAGVASALLLTVS